jgi:Zn-dependent protease
MDGNTTLLIRDGIVYLLALIMSICVHEFGHAFVADKLGDPLPRAQGRVTLNPLAHIDPIGTLLLPILGFAFSASGSAMGSRILGWGKPVQVSLSPRALTKKLSVTTSHALIAFSGPLMNLLFAAVLSGVFVALGRFASGRTLQLVNPLASVIAMNIGLAFFNLLPCPPLDGGAILKWLLPRSLSWVSDELEKYGSFVLLALLMTGALRYFMIPARIAAGFWIDHLVGWAL